MPSLSGAIATAPPVDPTLSETEGSARDRLSAARFASASPSDPRLPIPPSLDEDEADVRGFRLGWKTSLLFTLVLLATPLGLVIALPPVMACREQADRLGFFAGETMRGCVERRLSKRLTRLEHRITMLVRGSGR